MVAQNMLCTYEVNWAFFEKKIGLDESFDVTKCFQQIEISDLLYLCAPRSELPSNISTMETVLYCTVNCTFAAGNVEEKNYEEKHRFL